MYICTWSYLTSVYIRANYIRMYRYTYALYYVFFAIHSFLPFYRFLFSRVFLLVLFFLMWSFNALLWKWYGKAKETRERESMIQRFSRFACPTSMHSLSIEKLNLSSTSFLANCQWGGSLKSQMEITGESSFHPGISFCFLAKPSASHTADRRGVRYRMHWIAWIAMEQ